MREMCRFYLTAGIMSYTALYITPCVKVGHTRKNGRPPWKKQAVCIFSPGVLKRSSSSWMRSWSVMGIGRSDGLRDGGEKRAGLAYRCAIGAKIVQSLVSGT